MNKDIQKPNTGLPARDDELFEGNSGAGERGPVQVGGQRSTSKDALEHVLHLNVRRLEHRPVLGDGYHVRAYELVHRVVQQLGVYVVFVRVLCVLVISVVLNFCLGACLTRMSSPRADVSLASSKRTSLVGRRRRRRTGSSSLEPRLSVSPAYVLPQYVLHQSDPPVVFTRRGAICRRRVAVPPAASPSEQRLSVVGTRIIDTAG